MSDGLEVNHGAQKDVAAIKATMDAALRVLGPEAFRAMFIDVLRDADVFDPISWWKDEYTKAQGKVDLLKDKLEGVIRERDALAASRRAVMEAVNEKEAKIQSLAKQLQSALEANRLTNDKMADRERQARWEVADDVINLMGSSESLAKYAYGVRDANAPKE